MARKFDIHQLEEFLVRLQKSKNLTKQEQLEVEKFIQLVRDLKEDGTDSEVVVAVLTLIAQFLIEYFKNGN